MRRRVFLYIGDELADLSVESFVLVNLSREDLTDPQAVENAWTQAVTLPNTGRNAAILGDYYRLDRRTVGGGGTAINFAALKRTPFRLLDTTGVMLMRGYLKLESATEEAFAVTLYGGLGQFFYDLTYGANGSKLTLADCPYQWTGTWYAAAEIYIRCWRTAVNAAWGALRYGAPSSGQAYDIINFAPCLNGTTYPFKFDTNKATYRGGAGASQKYPNLYTSKTEGGKTYTPPNGESTVLLQFGQKHNEWEMQELRSYCQRPVISLRKMLEGVQRKAYNLGYTLTYDPDWWNDDNTYLQRVWMTLPFVDRDNLDTVTLQMMTAADFLGGTLSPAEYLLAVAKTFGFVFDTSPDGTTVYMRMRDNFYQGKINGSGVVDLTDRIDRSRAMTVRPYDIAARYYDWQEEMAGIFCANYEAKYGRKYGSQRLDTGYDFDNSVKEVTGSLPWKGCADVIDISDGYQVVTGSSDPDYGTAVNYLCKFAFTDTVKWNLMYSDPVGNNPDETKSFEPLDLPNYGGMNYRTGQGHYGQMWFALPQLHDDGGKAYDKGGVLLFYEGMKDTPVLKAGNLVIADAAFRITDDNAQALDLNGGVPCWDISLPGSGANVMDVAQIPSFRRWHFSGSAMQLSLDWGDPLEVPDTGDAFATGKGLFALYWADYMADRLDQDGSVLTAWVDLDGLQVTDALFRRAFYYEGSQWALNKIKNHSVTMLGPTECEFVRVKAWRSYTTGQLNF